ncbi:M23 family metallopeptidase [Pelomonas sp. KK5]|uniref:M23 family metallopeptidase n=1 Tax=Pelomonas sp. KK5 TaxID=1855730 RepID=UPI001E3E2C4D|nr:M23 family metallopeptidase [Pelomonas sp. KK5]
MVGLLSGFAVTAFGIAPLAPDAGDLPQRLVTETVQPQGNFDAQLAELAAHELVLRRSEQTRATDTADALLRRLGALDPAASQFLRSDTTARRLLQGRAGKMVELAADASGTVQSIVARYPAENAEQQATHFTRLTIERQADGKFTSKVETAPLETQVRLGSGTIRTSLFAATDESNIPDGIASQMADMFSGDVDFHRELQKGDRFSVVYEAMTADGEPISWDASNGHLIAGEFVNKGKSYQSVWFKDGVTGKGNFYAFDGQSKRHSFLANPVEFSRITSGFAMRFHPILQSWRQHKGVDFGAPTGTAVRSVGDGTVDFAGWQNGYGNVIKIQHSGSRETVYAHLSRIEVKKGQKIGQGQTIGAVGMTGWATGPHLHFEFQVNGTQQDPRAIAKASDAATLPGYARAKFAQTVASVTTQLQVARSMQASDGISGAE